MHFRSFRMSRSQLIASSAVIVLALGVACSRQSSSPTSPSAQAPGSGGAPAAADGSTLKVTAPTPISPVNNQQVTETPTLTAGVSTLKFAVGSLQYRFQLFSDTAALL